MISDPWRSATPHNRYAQTCKRFHTAMNSLVIFSGRRSTHWQPWSSWYHQAGRVHLLCAVSMAGSSHSCAPAYWVAELPEGNPTSQAWLDADPTDHPADRQYLHVIEQARDHRTYAFHSRKVYPDYRLLNNIKHAGKPRLAPASWRADESIAAMAEGSDARVMEAELGETVGLVTNELNESISSSAVCSCQCL